MEDDITKDFYAFRGFVELSNQLNLFDDSFEDSPEYKSKIFRSFFEGLEIKKNMSSKSFKKRKYFLLYCGKENNIIYCKLARRKEYKKDDLVDFKIITTEEHSYPNINVFIDMQSQKFLIESKTDVFENYNTCIDVIKTIIDAYINNKNAYIEIESIVSESIFWNAFNNNVPVYSIEFKLNSPNLFDGDGNAEEFIRESKKNTKADKTTLKFENNKDGLEINREGIDSYVRYTSDGGGSWKQKIKSENGRRITISSKQVNKKIEMQIDEETTNTGEISKKTYKNVITKFRSIETIEKFKS